MNNLFAIFNLGGGEIILILALILILFGAKKLPELAKGLGTGIKEFKKATKEVTDEIQHAGEDTYTPPPPKRIEEPPQKVAQIPEAEKPVAQTPEHKA